MATSFHYIKGPSDFQFGDDFELFWDRFKDFVTSSKCEKASQFSFLKAHLDDRSLRRIQDITFSTEHKTEPGEAGVVDLSNPSVVQLIKNALTKNPDIPERISLKFKVQGSSEGVVEFGDAIRLLGQIQIRQ